MIGEPSVRANPEKPRSITADRNSNHLTIQWSDGHTSNYSFELLRAACPCVNCQGGHANMRAEPDRNVYSHQLEVSPATRMRSLEGVGSYGVLIEWEDGHRYGIYNWHYLRALCPCPTCREVWDHVG